MFTPFAFMATPAAAGPTDADAIAYIDEVIAQGGTLSSGDQSAIDTLYLDLKSNSLYSELVYMYPFMGATADSHKVEGLAPTDANKILTWVGDISQSLAHTSAGVDKTVATSDGFGFANTNIDTFHSNVNDIAFGAYVSTATTGDLGFLISYTGSQGFYDRYQLNTPYDSDNVYAGFGFADALAVYDNTVPAVGRWIGSRVSLTDMQLYKNGSSVVTNTTNNGSGTLNGSPLELFSAGGSAGTNPVINGFDGVCGFIFGANGLSGAQVSTLDGILSTYLTAIGR